MAARDLDDLVKGYFAWRRRLSAPGLNPVEDQGMVPRERCAKPRCRAPKARAMRTLPSGGHACSLCGSFWPADHSYLLRGSYQRPTRARAGASAEVDRWATVGAVLGRFLDERHWPARVYLERVAVGRSVKALAKLASVDHDWRKVGPWSTRRIQELEHAARHDLALRFGARGIAVSVPEVPDWCNPARE